MKLESLTVILSSHQKLKTRILAVSELFIFDANYYTHTVPTKTHCLVKINNFYNIFVASVSWAQFLWNFFYVSFPKQKGALKL